MIILTEIFQQLFEEGMRKEGLDFIKHNVAINVTNT